MSAPNAAYISSGLTMFFSDLPILPNSRVTGWPCQVKAVPVGVALLDLLGLDVLAAAVA